MMNPLSPRVPQVLVTKVKHRTLETDYKMPRILMNKLRSARSALKPTFLSQILEQRRKLATLNLQLLLWLQM